jgi:hypothetical protein
MPSVTDWISSIGSLVGALTGVGALIVAVLSYRKSNKALAADAQTRGAVGLTLEAVEALGQAGQFDAMLDAALTRRADAETHGVAVEGDYTIRSERPLGRDEGDAYLVALENARRELGLTK